MSPRSRRVLSRGDAAHSAPTVSHNVQLAQTRLPDNLVVLHYERLREPQLQKHQHGALGRGEATVVWSAAGTTHAQVNVNSQ